MELAESAAQPERRQCNDSADRFIRGIVHKICSTYEPPTGHFICQSSWQLEQGKLKSNFMIDMHTAIYFATIG